MPKRGTPRAVRHATIVVVPDGFTVQCVSCNWLLAQTFTSRAKAQAAVDMHEIIRHTPKPQP